MVKSTYVFESGSAVVVDEGGTNPVVYVSGKGLTDTGQSAYVFESGSGINTSSTEELPPPPGTAPDMSIGRKAHAAGLINGKMYVNGGDGTTNTSESTTNDSTVLDISSETWSSFADSPKVHAGTGEGDLVLSGKMYLLGANNPDSDMNIEYDSATDTWVENTPTPTNHENGYTCSAGSRIYAGLGNENPANEIYDPGTDTYSTGSNVPRNTGRTHPGAREIGGVVWLFCGYQEYVDSYDPGADAWTAHADSVLGMGDFQSAELSGILYGFGGTENAGGSEAVKYDTTTESSTQKSDIPNGKDARGVMTDGAALINGGTSTPEQTTIYNDL